MRKAIIPVELSLLEDLLMLPPGYKIETLWPGDEQGTVNFLVSSDALPDAEGNHLPEIDLHCTVQNHPDHPDFKRITIIPRTQKAIATVRNPLPEKGA